MTTEEKVWELLEMCYYGHIDQVKRLIGEGIDVNAVGRNGMSPIEAASDGKNEDIVNYLLSVGAKENLR